MTLLPPMARLERVAALSALETPPAEELAAAAAAAAADDVQPKL